MKKKIILLFVITLTLLASCFKMTVEQLSHEAETINKQCPIDLPYIGQIVSATSEDSILVFKVQLNPFDPNSSEMDESKTLFREDSLASRKEDTKLVIGSLFFRPLKADTNTSNPLTNFENMGKTVRNNAYDQLIRMGGKIRVDIVREDGSAVTSVLYSAKEIKEQIELCYNRVNSDSLTLDAILELERAKNKLQIPQVQEYGLLTDLDFDKEAFKMCVEIDDKKMGISLKYLNEKNLHNELIKALNSEMGYTFMDAPIFSGAKTYNDERDVVEACIKTHRNIEVMYFTKSKRKQFKIILTEEDLRKILAERNYEIPSLDTIPYINYN